MAIFATRFMWFVAVCSAFVTCSAWVAAAAHGFGEGEVLAPILAQAAFCAGQPGCNGGFPEGVAVAQSRVYVTDSLQATIYRIPSGGGSVEIWCQSPLLAGSLAAPLPFGANGIRVSPDRDFVYVVVSFDAADPGLGHVYRIPLVDAPNPGDIELVHTFSGSVVPDSLVFGYDGTLYVSLASSNQIAVLAPNANEISRISGPAGSPIPFDAPATMTFDYAKKSILVAHHAIFGDPAHFAVLRIFVDDPGNPRPAPSIP